MTFTIFSPDFSEWADQIDWELRFSLDGEPVAGEVMQKMADLGFTVIPPPMPHYAVTYNGHAVLRTDSRDEAEGFLSRLRTTTGYEIRDREQA